MSTKCACAVGHTLPTAIPSIILNTNKIIQLLEKAIAEVTIAYIVVPAIITCLLPILSLSAPAFGALIIRPIMNPEITYPIWTAVAPIFSPKVGIKGTKIPKPMFSIMDTASNAMNSLAFLPYRSK